MKAAHAGERRFFNYLAGVSAVIRELVVSAYKNRFFFSCIKESIVYNTRNKNYSWRNCI